MVWASPKPERTIAVAMRRCYSTKPIEEIEEELDEKGIDYWKYLLTRAIKDKSLDVFEHFCLELLVEDFRREDALSLASMFPFVRMLQLNDNDWLVSMNSRTLIEMWRGKDQIGLSKAVAAELTAKGVGTIFAEVVFGGRALES